jgi:predicted DCC family thiol-disulfide oxidoreductase YuxK
MLFSGRDPNDLSSILVVQEDGSCLCESDAVLRIAQGLEGVLFDSLVLVGQHLIPTPLRDSLYHFVSQNRHKFGESDTCRLDWDGEYENRFLKDPQDS